jgi:hypothetical protein
LPIAQQHINFLLVDSQIRDYETVFHFQGSALHSCILRRFSTSKFASYVGEFELFSQRKIKNILRIRIPSALQQGSTSSRCTASSKAFRHVRTLGLQIRLLPTYPFRFAGSSVTPLLAGPGLL